MNKLVLHGLDVPQYSRHCLCQLTEFAFVEHHVVNVWADVEGYSGSCGVLFATILPL